MTKLKIYNAVIVGDKELVGKLFSPTKLDQLLVDYKFIPNTEYGYITPKHTSCLQIEWNASLSHCESSKYTDRFVIKYVNYKLDKETYIKNFKRIIDKENLSNEEFLQSFSNAIGENVMAVIQNDSHFVTQEDLYFYDYKKPLQLHLLLAKDAAFKPSPEVKTPAILSCNKLKKLDKSNLSLYNSLVKSMGHLDDRGFTYIKSFCEELDGIAIRMEYTTEFHSELMKAIKYYESEILDEAFKGKLKEILKPLHKTFSFGLLCHSMEDHVDSTGKIVLLCDRENKEQENKK